MKIMTVLGTRPELIRLSVTIGKLDRHAEHVLVHTGQNFDESLSGIFFKELCLRPPDYYLGVRGDSFGEQVGSIIIETEKVIRKERPDRILILGDTNSGLVCIVAKRLGIPIFHMEAGNRCFDNRVPEEVNRKIIDHCSTVHMPYTHRSMQNLLDEGIRSEFVHVIGNPINEVLQHFQRGIDASTVLDQLQLRPRQYLLATLHRAENVDCAETLQGILAGIDEAAAQCGAPVICSLHPRTRNKLQIFGITPSDRIRLCIPFGFFDFVALEKNALCVITDSGTVQEESCILRVPNVTIREVTERPETIDSGSNIIAGVCRDEIVSAVNLALQENCDWDPPVEYQEKDVSSKVLKLLLGHLERHST